MAKRARRNQPPPPLHELEREIMEQVWRAGPAPVREILDGINATAERERAYTTVLTVLGRLEEKGFVTREREGRRDVYAAAVERDTWMRGRASGDVDRLLDAYGDVALAHFAEQVERLDDARRAELRRLLDE
ncbi:BlaI/MecI/CopY family transcriptional regulator [Conexibacter arvalis]|uniref:Putative transcriptional regulator n=1 Tax=Conexibacter arvalis TaxID=912552 RepID=A0A840IKQ4_9ACTN|nr:BlaI/MecI/CopY family transcriptional regulator [Conexibacter arvalis]MBB4664518.1 putative transcriptional regulator [Conexibacter arvalis]